MEQLQASTPTVHGLAGKYLFEDESEQHWRDCRVLDVSSAGAGLELLETAPGQLVGRASFWPCTCEVSSATRSPPSAITSGRASSSWISPPRSVSISTPWPSSRPPGSHDRIGETCGDPAGGPISIPPCAGAQGCRDPTGTNPPEAAVTSPTTASAPEPASATGHDSRLDGPSETVRVRRGGGGRAGDVGDWLTGVTGRAVPGQGEPDVLLGFGLVAAFCVMVIATERFLQLGHESRWTVGAILAVTTVLDLGLLLLFRRWPTRPMLLGFPVLLVLSELALAYFSPAGEAVGYAGFITLAFVYIGLTQARGVGLLFTVVAGPAWVFVQRPWSAEVGVKLFLALAVWLLISEVLAARTERARARTRRLVAQANSDVLTGLGSRLFLSDHIERVAGEDATPGSVLLFVNIDGFKVINDTYGHSAGDELLVVVAQRVQSLLRPNDLAARLSGDEFAALIDRCTLGQSESLARRMLAALGTPYQLSRGRVAITASIGIVEIESRPPRRSSCATPTGPCGKPRWPGGTAARSTKTPCSSGR